MKTLGAFLCLILTPLSLSRLCHFVSFQSFGLLVLNTENAKLLLVCAKLVYRISFARTTLRWPFITLPLHLSSHTKHKYAFQFVYSLKWTVFTHTLWQNENNVAVVTLAMILRCIWQLTAAPPMVECGTPYGRYACEQSLRASRGPCRHYARKISRWNNRAVAKSVGRTTRRWLVLNVTYSVPIHRERDRQRTARFTGFLAWRAIAQRTQYIRLNTKDTRIHCVPCTSPSYSTSPTAAENSVSQSSHRKYGRLPSRDHTLIANS